LNNFYLTRRFFIGLGLIAFAFTLSFSVKFLFPIAQTALVVYVGALLADAMLLFNKSMQVVAKRHVPKLMSLGDENKIELDISNNSTIPLSTKVVDEVPFQFQDRKFMEKLNLGSKEVRKLTYSLRPIERGEYVFNNVNIFISSLIGLAERRIVVKSEANMLVPVYPSVLQMRNFELKAFKQIAHESGIRKIRRLGHSYEFEQIKNYVPGDDFRSINWKASSRKNALMVNQYEDERSQQVYCIIDKSRVMRMPFQGMSLIDHSVNACLVMSNIVLQKKDKVGLFSFSDKLGSALQADRAPNQLNRILHELYKEKEGKGEASYELLYYSIRKLIKGRSLLMLFTNYESMFALDRTLPTLRLINNLHLLVVVIFINTEVDDFTKTRAENTEGIYQQTIARKYMNEKTQMVQKLRQYGIQTILTRPEDLSINTINKYLELKSKGAI
jgi:uncharacterized protein (DUF58 family)